MAMPKGFYGAKKDLLHFFFNDIHYVFLLQRKKIHWARVSSQVELIPIFI
jgi:hypothetical protein